MAPPFLYEISEIKEIYDKSQFAYNNLTNAIEDLNNQCFVKKSTKGKGLDEWEKFLDIYENKKEGEQFRREAIVAKIQGNGAITKAKLKEIAGNFSGGTIDIIEVPREGKFIIKFIDKDGIPENINGFKSLIDSLIPAHLDYEIQYKYLIWGIVEDKTWQDVENVLWGT